MNYVVDMKKSDSQIIKICEKCAKPLSEHNIKWNNTTKRYEETRS